MARSRLAAADQFKEVSVDKALWMRAGAAAMIAGVAATMAGCSPQPKAAAAVVKDKVYTVTPDTLTVKAGMVSGEVTELKVTERVEEGTGKVETPAKLSGKLVLKNNSSDQSMRLVAGRISYIDAQGKPLKLEDNRTEPTLRVSSSYGTTDRLDPGQDSAQAVDAEFPAAALKAKRLKEIRMELTFIPTPFREATLTFPVSIGGQ